MSAPGSWPSPITAALVAGSRVRLADLQVAGSAVYWVEGRPSESGRSVIVRHHAGQTGDVLAPPFSARTSVHEYGGGAFLVHDDIVYFSSAEDGRLLRQPLSGGEPVTVTGAPGLRFADFVADPRRGRLITVVEDHRHPGRVENYLGAVPMTGGEVDVLSRGADFYAAPRLSADGHHLAWLTWDLPAMPWDASALSVAHVDNRSGALAQPRTIAGGAGESVLSPSWSPDGRLHFISDRSGWWNLHVAEAASVRCLAPLVTECGQPPWVFGLQPYAFIDRRRIALAGACDGVWRLFILDTTSGDVRDLQLPFTELGDQVAVIDGAVVTIAGGPSAPPSVVRIDVESGEHEVIRPSFSIDIEAGCISAGEPVSFESDGISAHAFVYPPANPEHRLTADQKPPLVVRAHGGPTAQASTSLDPTVQFYTSRGFAFCDVDYRGSSGYGRSYRHALHGEFGSADVADCLAAARHLAESGVVDPERMFIRGGSSGGHIALLAVCGHHVFAGASSQFGIADLTLLAADTHKFESRYLDVLIGPLPEAEALYRQRSPVHRVEEIDVPVVLFQGLDDRVVPPAQTELMYQALRRRGITSGYVAFEGEGHGFRQAANLVRFLETELWFLQRVAGLEPEQPEINLELGAG